MQLTSSLTEQMHAESKACCDALTLELAQLRTALADQQRLHATACADLSEAKPADGRLGSSSSDKQIVTAKQHTKLKHKLSSRLPNPVEKK